MFKPNDYFFEHHVQPGEEKWQAYMRVVRQIMAEQLGFELSPLKLEDKFAYKAILYPSRGDKTKND